MPAPPYPDVTVLLPDPSLPDATKLGSVFSTEDLESIERVRGALEELAGYRFEWWQDHGRLLELLGSRKPGFVLNLCDTGFSNVAVQELHVPALLEMFGVPYSGSPPACLGLCYDKALVRAVAADCGVPVPRQRYLAVGEEPGDLGFPFPALVKPSRGDGGVGITVGSVVSGRPGLEEAVARLRGEHPGQGLLVQEFLDGDEYGLGLVGNPGLGFTVLPPLKVDWSGLPKGLPRILGYESKTLPDSPYWTELRFREAGLDPEVQDRMVRHGEMLFERLGCRDYARFDFRAGADGVVRLLEVNPNPAWCWDGKLNMMAEVAGMTYSGLLGAILETAQRRAAGAV